MQDMREVVSEVDVPRVFGEERALAFRRIQQMFLCRKRMVKRGGEEKNEWSMLRERKRSWTGRGKVRLGRGAQSG